MFIPTRSVSFSLLNLTEIILSQYPSFPCVFNLFFGIFYFSPLFWLQVNLNQQKMHPQRVKILSEPFDKLTCFTLSEPFMN
jgi:hypothetical protein